MTDVAAFLLAGALIVAGGVLVAFETALGRISFSRIEELEVRLTRRGNAAVQALKSDPIRELDRWVRLATPLVQRAVRAARTSIEN